MNRQSFIIWLVIIIGGGIVTEAWCQGIQRYDVIISEIMADPTPVIGLPAVEYIELHNRTSDTVVLCGWHLQVGSSDKALPDILLPARGFAVICAEKYTEEMLVHCSNCYGVSSLSITDGGQQLTLRDANAAVIHHVAFKRNWHTESIKADGGWSLEMVDTRHPCLERENWRSSNSPTGGTPGAANQFAEILDDTDSPMLRAVTLADRQTIRVLFSEPVHPDLPIANETIELEPPIAVLQIAEVPPVFSALDIHLADTLRDGTLYHLRFARRLCDCAGNTLAAGSEILVGTPHPPQASDLIINEILTHPRAGSDADYIEIFNRSDHIIDLKSVKIGGGGNNVPDKAVTAAASGWQLPPQQYACLCKNLELTKSQYHCPDERALLSCDSLPAYANSSGIVWLCDPALRCIDRFAYDEEMHSPELVTTEGVSLERLHCDRRTQDAGNWISAASSAGFGTPGAPNSQHAPDGQAGNFQVTPAVISPDNDGFEDFAEITVNLAEPGCMVSITLHDALGHPVRHLVNNQLCGRENLFRWDGDDDNGNRLPSGMYLIVMQWRNPQGSIDRRKAVVSIRW